MFEDNNASGQHHGRSTPDRARIDVNQAYELRDWAENLNSTPERVKEAAQAVGNRIDEIREWLNQTTPAPASEEPT
jgi:small-conductance mechanosensitive channel